MNCNRITDATIRAAVSAVSASSRRSPSRASWMMRLMGADSGLTIATMRLAATMLPNPMINEIHIRIPLRLTDDGAELAEMAAEADDLLGVVDLIRIDGRLLDEPRLIGLMGAQELLYRFLQALPVRGDDGRRELAQARDTRREPVDAREEVLLDMAAFRLPHRIKLPEGLGKCLPEWFLHAREFLPLLHADDVRVRGDIRLLSTRLPHRIKLPEGPDGPPRLEFRLSSHHVRCNTSSAR